MKRIRITIKKEKKESSIHIGLVIYLFLFLFAPPLVKGINFGIIVAVLSVPYLLYFFSDVVRIFFKSRMKAWAIGELVYLVYMLIVAFIYYMIGEGVNSSNYIVNVYQVFMIIPITLLGVLTILLFCKRNYINFNSLLKHFVIAALIQSGMAIGAFLSPAIKQFFLVTMANNTGDEILTRVYLTNLRFFGFSNSMLDAFGVGTGILAALPLYINSDDRKKYMFLIPALIVVPLLNARTGLIIFAVGVFFAFIKRAYSGKEILKLIGTFLIMMIIIAILLSFLKIKYPMTYRWVVRDFYAFLGSDYRDPTSTLTVLFGEKFWNLPKFPDIVFGTGHTVYQAEGFTHSDVGYVNKIWNVGIVGMLFQYGIYGLCFYRAGKSSTNSVQSLLIAFFVATFFIYEIKGNMLTFTPGLTIIMTVVFYMISDKKIKYAQIKR